MSKKHHQTYKVLSKEAKRLIEIGEGHKIKDPTTGKIKRQYVNIHTKHTLYK